VEGIVQAAVDELFSVLGTSRAFVRLTSPDQREARRPLRDQRGARRRSPSPTRDVKVE